MGFFNFLAPADRIDAATARDHLSQGALLLDVRTRGEHAARHINGSVNIPLAELPRRLDEIQGERTVVVFCRSGNRSAKAVKLLRARRPGPAYDLGAITSWA